jgi:hypothetical protein
MNVTRIMIRATGEKPWKDTTRAILVSRLSRLIHARLVAGEFEYGTYVGPPQILTELELFNVNPVVPKNAARAKEEGYLREENPFPPRTPAHARWDRVYLETVVWDIE